MLFYHTHFACLARLLVTLTAIVVATPQLHAQGRDFPKDLRGKLIPANEELARALGIEIARTPDGAGVAGHGAIVHEDRLYLLGGYRVPQDPRAGQSPIATAQVWSAPILPGGAPGPWRPEAPLPSPRARIQRACATAAEGKLLLVAGGHAGPAILLPPPPALRSGAGTIEPQPIPVAPAVPGAPGASHSDATAGPPSSTGVPPGSTFADTLLLGRRTESGTLQWHESPPFPGGPRCDVALAVHGNDVYVIGGRQPNGDATAQVLRATLDDQLELGPWQEDTPLPEPRLGASAGIFHPRYLGVAGGRTSWKAIAQRETWLAPLPPPTTGTLTAAGKRPPLAWTASPMLSPRGFADASALPADSRWYVLRAPETNAEKPATGTHGTLDATYSANGIVSPWRSDAVGIRGFALQAMSMDPAGQYIYRVGGLDSTTSQGLSNAVGVIALSSPATVAAANPRNKLHQIARPPRQTLEKVSPERYFPPQRFLSEEEALAQAKRRERPMLVLVWASGDAEAAKYRQEIDENRGFFPAMSGIVLAEVDATADPAAAARLGAPSYPCWILYDATGKVIEHDTKSRSLQDLTQLTFKVR